MKQSTPRPYHHGNLRAELLKQAEKELRRVGYRELSLREISRAAGVSHAASRRHFADKAALLDALACEGFSRVHQLMIEVTKDDQSPFEPCLIRIGQAYVDFAKKNPALMDVMFALRRRGISSEELSAISQRAYVPAINCFARAQQSGEIVAGEPIRLAFVVFSALEGLISLTEIEKFKEIGIDTLVVEVLNCLIFGLKPRA